MGENSFPMPSAKVGWERTKKAQSAPSVPTILSISLSENPSWKVSLSSRIMVRDTDKGRVLGEQIKELQELLYAYRHGIIK